ncbi:hypothetical protein PABG_05217 [Paracoccidioides brasiliensis Pb03]|nr:hypothetical protein PABG_05217 [Paracoccidioides brasiliensis Pb03]
MAPVERIAENLEKPVVYDRLYCVIRLPNELDAFLVHDPNSDKASASVNVNVGNFSDDDDLPGIAHAHPKENAYNQYLEAHAGYSNAYAAVTEMNYYFELDVATPATSASALSNDLVPLLYGALDQFAQFFIAPLFLKDGPQSHGVDLVVLEQESLDELESWVAELFADVENKNLLKLQWDDSLDIYFRYQNEEDMFNTQLSRYISHLISHEGPGSILAYIRAKEWAHELSAGSMAFKKDDTFWVPKGLIEITLQSPFVYASPGSNVSSRLFCELVRDSLSDYSYDAELAGLDYNLSTSVFGLEISVSGYNDKMAVLFEKVLLSMRDLKVKPDRFWTVKERMSKAFWNAEYQLPCYQVGNFTRYLTAEKAWRNEQLAAELEHIEAEDVSSFFPQLLRQTHLEILGHERAHYLNSQWHVQRNIIIPPGSNYIFENMLKDPANVNNCIEYYLFVGSIADPLLRAKSLLFSQLTSEPAFNQLRTQEQLGYVVWSSARFAATTLGYCVTIQSDKTNEYLESRIDAFLSQFAAALGSIIINKQLEKLTNLNSETSHYWSHIGSGYFDFVQHEKDVETLTKPQMVEFYRRYIDPESSTRSKLSIHMNAQSSAHKATPEQKTQLVDKFRNILASTEIQFDSDKLKTSFDDVEISCKAKDAIASQIKTFLESEVKASPSQVDNIVGLVTDELDDLLQTISGKPSPSDGKKGGHQQRQQQLHRQSYSKDADIYYQRS